MPENTYGCRYPPIGLHSSSLVGDGGSSVVDWPPYFFAGPNGPPERGYSSLRTLTTHSKVLPFVHPQKTTSADQSFLYLSAPSSYLYHVQPTVPPRNSLGFPAVPTGQSGPQTSLTRLMRASQPLPGAPTWTLPRHHTNERYPPTCPAFRPSPDPTCAGPPFRETRVTTTLAPSTAAASRWRSTLASPFHHRRSRLRVQKPQRPLPST